MVYFIRIYGFWAPPTVFRGWKIFFFSSCRHYNSGNPCQKNFLAAPKLVSVYPLKIIWGWGVKNLEHHIPIYSLRDTLKKKNFSLRSKFFFYKVSLVPIFTSNLIHSEIARKKKPNFSQNNSNWKKFKPF